MQAQSILKATSVAVAVAAVSFTVMNVLTAVNADNGLRMTQPIDRRDDWESLATKGIKAGTQEKGITIVAFIDYECQACGRFHASIEAARRLYGERLSLVWRHFPRPASDGGLAAAIAAECSAQFGKFTEYSQDLFNESVPLTEGHLLDLAESAGIVDTAGFGRCQRDGSVRARVEEDLQAGQEIGIMGTPTFLVNDAVYFGMPSDLHHILRAAIANANRSRTTRAQGP